MLSLVAFPVLPFILNEASQQEHEVDDATAFLLGTVTGEDI
jgi:hypothetical protein